MQKIDKIIQSRWIITVDSDFRVLENAAMAIHEGIIQAIDTIDSIQAQYQADESVELMQHALMPGFVNAHNHAAMTLLRGYADDMELMTWLTEHIWPAEQKHVDPHFIEIGTKLCAAEMIKSGTTTFNEMYFFPDVAGKVAESVGMRAMLGMIVIDFPTPWAQTPDEYFSKGLALHDEFRHSTRIHTAFAPHAPYTVCNDSLSRIAVLAEELDVPVHMHLHETQTEIEQSMAQYNMRPLERIDSLGLVNDRLIAVHMTQLMSGEMKTLANRGVNIVHCPQSNMKLASGFCEVAQLQSQGVNVALGTDGASSNNDVDMLEEMRFAALLAKGVSQDPKALNANDSIKMATINGAKALGLDDIIGSLEPGKAADMIAIDLSDLSTIPVFSPVSQIVYSASRHQISDVWVAGKALMRNHELHTIDSEKLSDQIKQIHVSLQAE